jgi:diadenosine tetraphosphate (Ap4A) HIT family hydrolase
VEGCVLCDPGLASVLAETEHWKLVLNKRNQDLLGKCFLSLRRHEEAVTALRTEEWADLRIGTARAAEGIPSTTRRGKGTGAFLRAMRPARLRPRRCVGFGRRLG